MTGLPFAFAIYHFISSVGEDAGVAAIIGLVILAVLHFVQARETTGIRERIEHTATRIPQLEQQAARLVPEAYRSPGPVGPPRRAVARALVSAAEPDPVYPGAPGSPRGPVQARPQGATGVIRLGSASASRSAKRPTESRAARGLVVLLSAVAVAVVAAITLIAKSGGPKTATTTRGPVSSASGSGHHTRTVQVVASSVTVTVLNGTSTTGLAHTISLRLAHAGFKPGQVTNAASQAQTTTLVGYTPHHQADALAVTKVLKLASNPVRPVAAAAEAIACAPARTCNSATVVVTVGADLAAP
jgi:hypothetical protein